MTIKKRDKIKNKLKALTEKDMLRAMKRTLNKGFLLFSGKLKDYGLDTYKTVGAIGIYLRMREKFDRLDNLLKSKEEANYESIKDNIQDIFVLGATLMAMLEKELADTEEMRKQYRALVEEDEE